jgi:type IX secretion system PorP/SprF family membrane protein
MNDVIGPTQTMGANIAYAYRIPMGKARLAVGLQGGVINWNADWSDLNLEQVDDEAYQPIENRIVPNFGAGVYFSTDSWYLGVGVPHLIEHDLREDNINTPQWAKQYRHYFFSGGAAIPVKGDAIIFKPSILVKSVGLLSSLNKDDVYQNIGAPTEFDLDVSFMFYRTLWIGTSFRSSVEAFTDDSSSFDSVDFWAAYYLTNGLRIGAAYDYTLTKLQSTARGSFEIMLGYEFDYITKQMVTPRYF